MSVRVEIVEGPLGEVSEGSLRADGEAGSVLTFEGVVRRAEGEREIEALEYEVYEPMASRVMERLGRLVVDQHGLLSLHVQHSRGVVPVGRASLRVVIESRHRAASLAAMMMFIDELKKDVPIWKKPVWRLT